MASTDHHHQTNRHPLHILFHSFEGVGHHNSCIGFAQALVKHGGHQVTFVVNECYAGNFTRYGFDEYHLKYDETVVKTATTTTANNEEKANGYKPTQITAQQLIERGNFSNKSAYEKMADYFTGYNFIDILVDKLTQYDAQFTAALNHLKPDVIVLAQFLIPPAFAKVSTTIPLVFHYPCNPLGLYQSPRLPPHYLGLALDSDPATWHQYDSFFNDIYLARYRNAQAAVNKACGNFPGIPALQDPTTVPNSGRSFWSKSPLLTTYVYPRELDYDDIAGSTPPCTARVDTFCRVESNQAEVDAKFLRSLPTEFQQKTNSSPALIYFSLGTYGSADVQLMNRILSLLGRTRHRYIVSKGVHGADQIKLPPNCWGEPFLPQPSVLPLVDAVITHAGNNTLTETFKFGKPMLVMPLFFDQYDNANCITYKRYAIQLEPYTCTEEQLSAAIEQLLGDQELRQRCTMAAERIKREQGGHVELCRRIEQLVDKGVGVGGEEKK